MYDNIYYIIFILYYIILYCIILYYIILYYIILYYIVLYYIILYYIILYYIVLYYIILYYIILYCIILYYIILYYMIIYICIHIYIIICTYYIYIPSGKLLQIANWKITIKLIGKSTTNGSFSIAMLNYQRVYIYDNMYICVHTCIWIICSAVSGRTVGSC